MKSAKFLLPSLTAVFIISGIIFVSFAFKANASSPDSILVDMTPESPNPNENTTITLNSYVDDLNSVLISWSVNGKKSSSGIGKKSFSVNAGNIGSETTVSVTVTLSDGDITKNITIRPAGMVLLWQADDSYVPPFYKGKALPSGESEVKVVALPQIQSGSQLVDPTNMVYVWKQDYNNMPDSSGYGKNYFVYMNDYLDNSNNIDVIASTIDQKYSSEASIDISTYQPKILFYKNDANMGTLWEQTLSDGHKVDGDETIEADPYFISPKDIRIPMLTWSWSINDNFVNIASYLNQNLMPLKTQAGVSGTAKIGLEVKNTSKIFESANSEINVNF